MSDLIARVEAMRHKAKAREEAEAAARRERGEENRRRMPTVAKWVEQARAIFGADQVKVGYAKENGITLGTPTPDGIRISETIVGPWNKPRKP